MQVNKYSDREGVGLGVNRNLRRKRREEHVLTSA